MRAEGLGYREKTMYIKAHKKGHVRCSGAGKCHCDCV